MEQPGKPLITYSSRRKQLNTITISLCKRHTSVKSFPKKRVALKRNNEKDTTEIVKCGTKKNKRKLGKCDEVTRLQRRARYLLIRIKLEKNLLEAYYADGWKGQSREKIKPEKELQRAEKEIIKCKLGIREIVRELDLFISTCQCGSHHNSLESPEKVPGTDNKRLCKYDENKIMIIEATNAHLCTSFSIDSSYVDIFKEEATNPKGKDIQFKDEKEWPSDESEDEDYNPELNEVTCSSGNETEETDSKKFDLSNSSTCNSYSDKINFGEADEGEIMHRPRQRKNVDYMKLHDEMFGKDAQHEDENEDEEWGPHVRKKSRKEANEDQFMVVNSTSDANILDDDVPAHMSKYSRIPSSAVKELQLAFARNELPSRSVKENLSKQLGLSLKKVDVWFKNARCAALKLRKASTPNCEGKKRKSDEVLLLDASCFIPLSELIHVPKRSGCNLERERASKKKFVQDKVPLPETPFTRHVMRATCSHSSPGKRFDSKKGIGVEHPKLWLDLVRKMCVLHDRVHNLQKTLLLVHGCTSSGATIKTTPKVQDVMYVPFAQLKEKAKT